MGGRPAKPSKIALGRLRRLRRRNALHRNGELRPPIASPVSEGVSREKSRTPGGSLRERGTQDGAAQKGRLEAKEERPTGQASPRDYLVRPEAPPLHRVQDLADPPADPRDGRGHP